MTDKLPPPDSFLLEQDQKDEIQRLVALGYQPTEIAICLGLNPEAFETDAKSPGTVIFALIREGLFVSKAAPEVKLHKLASEGNLSAIQELQKIQERRNFENIVKQIDDDELAC